MTSKTATKQDTKTALLQVGMDLMMEKGYTNTGINDVLGALGIPKGSFYHHFDSKESYALEIIRYFDAQYSEAAARVLTNTSLSPLNRLRALCEDRKVALATGGCRKTCLIGSLSQEMADQSEVLRKELSNVMKRGREAVAECIAAGQKLKEIRSDRSPQELAALFQAAWSGTLMRAKTEKSLAPIDTFIDLMCNDVLKA
jgi:TetR/AcrR family transcriptional regulator, transcriptional repressor for nem operon